MTASSPLTELGPGLRAAQAVAIFLGYPSVLLQRWTGLFKPLESSVLDQLLVHLDPACSEIARVQLRAINRVQRITARRTESNLFRIVPFRVDPERGSKFRFAESEQLLATIRFELSSGLRQLAKVYVVHGNLFSIEFGGDMRRHWQDRLTSVISFKQHAACGV